MAAKELSLGFYGGAGKTTGSNFLISDGEKRILIDCGLTQGCRFCEDVNREPFRYDPKGIDALLVTHAHIDHVGRIPKLVRDGFRGAIYSTPPTREIAELMMMDSLGVLEKEARGEGKSLIYEETDVIQAMSLWKELPYHEELSIGEWRVVLKDAGHILGSSMAVCTYAGKNIAFTGDLGNSPAPLLRDTEPLTGLDYLIIESVYGDREHEGVGRRKEMLEGIIEDTVRRGGTLMIPAFSLERTQELLYEINSLVEGGRIPKLPIYIDSPLAIDVTKIYKKYTNYFNSDARGIIKSGDDIFNFPGLAFTYTTDESKAIRTVKPPKIVIAGSGMSNGGRIIHHEKLYLPDPSSTLLIIGYQVPGSLGRMLQDGAKNVRILGDDVVSRAQIETIHGYSAHKDSSGLLDVVAGSADTLKRVFVVLGEPRSSLFLAQRVKDYLGIEATVPALGAEVTIPV